METVAVEGFPVEPIVGNIWQILSISFLIPWIKIIPHGDRELCDSVK